MIGHDFVQATLTRVEERVSCNDQTTFTDGVAELLPRSAPSRRTNAVKIEVVGPGFGVVAGPVQVADRERVADGDGIPSEFVRLLFVGGGSERVAREVEVREECRVVEGKPMSMFVREVLDLSNGFSRRRLEKLQESSSVRAAGHKR